MVRARFFRCQARRRASTIARMYRLTSNALWAVCASALLTLASCTGEIINPDDAIVQSQVPRFTRLSHVQWENTVTDLFRLAEPPGLAQGFDSDPPLGRFDNNVERLKVTSGLWQDYQRAAENMAARVIADPVVLSTVVPADLPADPDAAARAFIESFGARAFRRPLTAPEIDRYAALFPEGAVHFASGDDFLDGVQITLEAMLQSPHFVYRVESSNTQENGRIRLSGYEIASRLSYLFWNTMPDDELMQAAAAGELDGPAGIRAQAERMFDDPRTRATFAHFHVQLFEMTEYGDLDKDPNLFPGWRRDIGDMMRTETELFLASIIFDKQGTIADLLTATHTYVNDELAAIYGLEGAFDGNFVEVELDPTRRAGLLTKLGFLARNATLTEPDPIHRGVFVNLNLICRPIGALPNLPENLEPMGDTNRERINSITGEGTCGAGCHSTIINPIGFAMENYDALGAYRTEDNGHPVDAAARYVFQDGRELVFENAIELSRQLAETPDLHSCYVSSLLEYIYGRGLDTGDAPQKSSLSFASLNDARPIRDLIFDVVVSDAFRYRTTN